jgi:hypothetical protein
MVVRSMVVLATTATVSVSTLGGAGAAFATGGAVSQISIRTFCSLVAAATNVDITLGFITPSALLLNTDTITLEGPVGTVFPSDINSYSIGNSDGYSRIYQPVVVSPQGNEVTITVPINIASGGPDPAQASVMVQGATNPAAGTYTLQVWTSKDSTPAMSPTYTIIAPTPGDGCGQLSPPTPAAPPVRVSGIDRFGTAIAASVTQFPTAGSAGGVVLARFDDYPDALVGAALAAARNAPLLFADGGTLTSSTQTEIERVLPRGATVYLLGGEAAIPASVATLLTSMGYVPQRYSGADRYGTALAVADALGDPTTVLLATGTSFPDALAAGPAAAHVHGVVLLTDGDTMPASVQAYLTTHPGTTYAVGGPAAAADRSATAILGPDRYQTATAVAITLFRDPPDVGIASGTTFADALAGGAFEAHFASPIVLSDPNSLPSQVGSYITTLAATISTTTIFGGTSAVSASVQTAIQTALSQQ